MSRVNTLRSRFVDAPGSIGAKARARRWKWFAETFPELPDMTVVDLGGAASTWLRASIHPRHVHIINLAHPSTDLPSWLSAEVADACELPATTLGTKYDLVFSNAVIEHVGGHVRRQRFADAVQALAGQHWVQTPYRYFPLEPHFLFPGFQFLPLVVRTEILRRWPLVHTPTADRDSARGIAMDVELLGVTELRHYFADSDIWYERVFGLVKSMIAVRRT